MAATTGNDDIIGTAYMDTLDPLAGDDKVYGAGGRDVFKASAGSDTLFGYRGDPGPAPGDFMGAVDEVDTLVFTSARGSVTLEQHAFVGFWGTNNAAHSVQGWRATAPSNAEGIEDFLSVERLVFSGGQAKALDIGNVDVPGQLGNAGTAAKLIGALFGPQAVHDEFIVGIILAGIDIGYSQDTIAQLVLDYLGVTTPEGVVRLVWDNLVDVPMIDSYLEMYVDAIEGGISLAHFAVLASDAFYNTDNIGLTGIHEGGPNLRATGINYQYYPVPIEVLVTAVEDAEATEGGTLAHPVVLSTPTTEVKVFSFVIAGGTSGAVDRGVITATAGVVVGDGIVTVPAGVLTFDLLIPLVDDDLDEGDETISVSVGGQQGSGTIFDNDLVAEVFTVNDAEAEEGGTLVFEVELLDTTTGISRLDFALDDSDSDTDPLSFSFSNGVTLDGDELVVPAGVIEFSVMLDTIDDSDFEGNEGVTIEIGGQFGFGTILDNDADPEARVLIVGQGPEAS